MPPMTKRVNVVTRIAVRTVNPPISGSYKNIIMSTSDILKCLSKRASVEEILPDGSTVKLNMKNYYLDNGAGLDAYANVDMDDAASAVPAFMALIAMVLSYSISNGIGVGAITYVLITLFSGNYKKKDIVVTIIAALFVARFLLITM